MKIAIHHRQGSFSEKWIEYCRQINIPFKVVNCYDSNIIDQIKDCDALMWHHHHENHKDVLFAKELLFSIESSGKIVFPDFRTNWHFDDKVGQKYLLEAFSAPLIPSFVFYDKKEAIQWTKITSFPKIFKLRGGAGSSNVKLVKNEKQAKKLIQKSFGKGFLPIDPVASMKERYRKVKEGKVSVRILLNGVARFFVPPKINKIKSSEKGYAYFQDFIPNLTYDIRVVTIGNKAVALKRMNRKDDFRASGSGNLIFENQNIDKNFIIEAFKMNKLLKTQCLAVDFVKNDDNKIFVVEVSYGFPSQNFLNGSKGYWDDRIKWQEGEFNPQAWMVEAIVNNLKVQN